MSGWLDDGRAVAVVYFDLSKALDTVCRNILMGKLRKCGLDAWAARWVENWLDGRALRALINEAESGWSPMASAVPEGRLIDTLMNLFISDLDEEEDHESCGSSSTNRSTTESMKLAVKPRRVQQSAPPDPDLPPGYVQSLIRRVVNNVNIVINNLILKYVEDDIVLSVNITSAECYTVDELWDRAFMDISATDLVLRKVINFSDCTVCLDKRNASGKIEFYQEPLLYKCSFRTRLHFTYDNLNSKMPSIIKIHTLVESLKLSISDQQLPMFIRIMQLGIALYYGEIGNFKDVESEDLVCHTKDMMGNIT
ncbi:PREDICTED: vacuolar protein sorting-associated protein 13B-like, partial [Tinamus guttatus]|uniref:vacuolar protein sorting-associated protein 13B-like n=1 Tax=Tinamus guttatus TaxID=94827 RepID=UPI00052F3D0F